MWSNNTRCWCLFHGVNVRSWSSHTTYLCILKIAAKLKKKTLPAKQVDWNHQTWEWHVQRYWRLARILHIKTQYQSIKMIFAFLKRKFQWQDTCIIYSKKYHIHIRMKNWPVVAFTHWILQLNRRSRSIKGQQILARETCVKYTCRLRF